jgi:hypothetical protein
MELCLSGHNCFAINQMRLDFISNGVTNNISDAFQYMVALKNILS